MFFTKRRQQRVEDNVKYMLQQALHSFINHIDKESILTKDQCDKLRNSLKYDEELMYMMIERDDKGNIKW